MVTWAPDYITRTEFKTWASITTTTFDDDIDIDITTSSRAVDDFCNRQFGQVAAAEERVYTARFNYARGVWVVDIDDLDDATGLVVDVGGSAVTAYTLEPVNAVLKSKVWTRLVVSADSATQPCGAANELSITGLWGWSTTPPSVKKATRLQTNRLGSRRTSPYGIAGSPDQGSELRLLSRVDPDVGVALRGYVRTRRPA